MTPSSTENNTDLGSSSRKTIFFRFWLKLLDFLIRPTIVGQLNLPANSTVYVLNFRSLIDIAVLELAAQKSSSPSPFHTVGGDLRERSFFCMRRSAGFKRRLVMFKFSERFIRLHERLTSEPEVDLQLVPVSIFWARVKPKQGSFLQSLFSERSNLTLGFRRLVCLFFNRTDILIHFGEPISWQGHLDRTQSVPHNIRTVARLLRNHFNETRQRVVGPENPASNRLVNSVLENPWNQTSSGAAVELNKSTLRIAKSYFHTISTKFSYPATKAFKMVLRPFWSRCFSGIRIDGLDQLETGAPYSLIYVPNHRSHLDYVLLSYVLFQHGWAIPHVASGDNLNMPFIGGILRRVGAFFIKRTYHDLEVYRNVLESYLYEVVNLGNSVEFFIEGTRSRTGWMLQPQFGFARLLLEYQQRGVTRPLAIVPVYVAYERLLEIASHRQELLGSQKRNESVFGVIRNLRTMSRAMGTLSIRFGEPIPVEEYVSQHPVSRDSTTIFAYEIVQSINSQAVLNAVHLVSLGIVRSQESEIEEELLLQRIDFLQTLLRVDSLNHKYQVPRESPQALVNQVLKQYKLKNKDGMLDLPQDFIDATFWFRNNVIHTLVVPALITYCVHQRHKIDRSELADHVTIFCRVVEHLLIFRHDAEAAQRWIQHLENNRLLVAENEMLTLTVDGSLVDRARLLISLARPWFLVIRELLDFSIQASTLAAPKTDSPYEWIYQKLQERFSAFDEEVPIEFHPNTLGTLDHSLGELIRNSDESQHPRSATPLPQLFELFDTYASLPI